VLKKLDRYNRRAFLSRSLSGMASLGFAGLTSKALSLKKPADKKIIHRQLGKTEIKIPVVSMGVYTTDPALIKAAFDAGVRYFSTAHYYQRGLCEKAIGDAIQDLGVRRDVIIATKIYSGMQRDGTWQENIKEPFLEQLSKSMDRLQTDYLDLLYLYNIRSTDEMGRPELLETLTELKQQKKVRYVGFTTHANHEEILEKALELDFYNTAAVAFNYTMSQNKALIQACEKAAQKGLGLVAMKTQCGSAWGVDGYRKPAEQLKNQTALLKWTLNHDFISTAIPAMEEFEHVEEDFSVAYDLDYTDEEKRFLEGENVRYTATFCQQCQKCVATCPKDVDIPTLMRTHMYAYQYLNLDLVNLAQKEIEASKGISACRSCEECKAVCLNSVPISKNISELKKLNWSLFA
jgi:predicted aldo/keto reductase-like oxidoreductase